jgi:catechol 2,3-dioxygenase-like lactoylglutathione lyase family enzyme
MTTTPAPRTHGVHHVAIQVRDLTAMEAFYGGVLGLPVLRRWQGDSGTRSIWFDLHDGGFLAIERVDGARRARDGFYTDDLGIHMVALAIKRDERDAWEAHLTAAGHEIVHRTEYTIYVRDPEGNRVGLSHWPDAETEAETA